MSDNTSSPLALLSQEELTLISNALTALLQEGGLSEYRSKMAYDLIQEITHADNLQLPNRRLPPKNPVFDSVPFDKLVVPFSKLDDDAKYAAYNNWKNETQRHAVSFDYFAKNHAHQWDFNAQGKMLDIPF